MPNLDITTNGSSLMGRKFVNMGASRALESTDLQERHGASHDAGEPLYRQNHD